jgi:hypothetical protein
MISPSVAPRISGDQSSPLVVPGKQAGQIHPAVFDAQNLDRVGHPRVEQQVARKSANEEAVNAYRLQVAPHPSQAWYFLDTPDAGHDFGVPPTSNLWRGFLSEMSNTFLEINPELRPEESLHVPFPDRANPRCKARTQSSGVAGLAWPLFMASSTPWW